MSPRTVSTSEPPPHKIVRYPRSARSGTCKSCGKDGLKGNRRYCSDECREQILWVLSLSKGLLRTFNARYAAFSFTRGHVILDVLPVWSKDISRFISKRTPGKKPAEDFKQLILRAGAEWHALVGNRKSRSYASLSILEKTQRKGLNPDSIKPHRDTRPRLSKSENDCLKVLELERADLISRDHIGRIRSAYKRMAKRHHPDVGGDEEKFKKLNTAREMMLLWSRNPQFTSRRALEDCWSYDGFANRWSPPM